MKNILSDGYSIPEKFLNSILKQLNVKYKHQLTKKNFKWCNEFRYDFFIYKYNIIIEAHGMQHYKDSNNSSWDNLEQVQWNDLFKYKCAKNHVDNYIVIDCRYSELEWLKENTIKELNGYFDLSNIDWELAWEESQKNLCFESWNLWDNGTHDVNEISDILNINRHTVTKYLKRGAECGKCDYTIEESRKNGREKIQYKKQNPIICLTTRRLFLSAKIGANYYNASHSHVCACCNGRDDRAGELNGMPLVWRYVNINHNKTYRIRGKMNYNPNINCRIVNNILNRKPKPRDGKGVICIETGEIFISVSEASKKKNIDRKSINLSIKKGWKAGGYHWKEID